MLGRFGLAFCAMLPWAALEAQQPHHTPHWSYEGEEGPAHWGKLDHAYAACAAGRAQSPIDIAGAKPADLPALTVAYQTVPLNILDNGHTIQVNYAPGSTLTVGDKTYTLKQFHFHHPSEEAINGQRADMVAHLVHADPSGKLAVIAILFKTGPASPLLDAVWKSIPAQKGTATNVLGVSLNVKDLLPADLGYYTFGGSLTTPPCSEGVTWFVLKTQATLSAEQLAAFTKRYAMNARPLQPANGRELLETR
jgi:carbonic anhydrase